MNKERDLGRNVTLLTYQKALVTAYFYIPIIVLVWQDIGLSMFEIMLLQAIFSIVTLLLEIPGGVLADTIGRKASLVIGSAANVLGVAVYCFADSFFDLLVAELFIAIFISMQSGADSALLYDTLKQQKREANYAEQLGRMIFYATIVGAAAHVLGGVVAAVELRYAIYASVPFVALGLVFALLLVEAPREHVIKDHWSAVQKTFTVLAGNRKLVTTVIYAGFIFGINMAGLWLYQPYMIATGVDIVFFGAIFASLQVVAAYAGRFFYLCRDAVGESAMLYITLILSCLGSLLLGAFQFLFSFVFIYLHQLTRGFYKVLFSDIVNREVGSEVRASMLSVQNMFGRLMSALTMPIVGWVADLYSLESAFLLIGVIGLTCGLPLCIYLALQFREGKESGS